MSAPRGQSPPPGAWFRASVFGFWGSDVEFGVWGLEFMVEGLGFVV